MEKQGTPPGVSGREATSSVPTTADRPLRKLSVVARTEWFLAGTVEQRRRFAAAAAEGRRAAAYQRSLILRHPDLAARLTKALRLARPEQWNGYIPPRFNEQGIHREEWHPNDTPMRALLVELVREAQSREAQ